ncbi:MAG TPA: hypothetical protein PKW20_10460, partial [Syntrophales bacterium]|nr:hypothetical protein [Syntrophales bacterium]
DPEARDELRQQHMSQVPQRTGAKRIEKEVSDLELRSLLRPPGMPVGEAGFFSLVGFSSGAKAPHSEQYGYYYGSYPVFY